MHLLGQVRERIQDDLFHNMQITLFSLYIPTLYCYICLVV